MDHASQSPVSGADESAIHALYHALLRAWNERDAEAFAALFIADGAMIGYDGTVVDGQDEIARHLGAIFAQHQTPAYIQKVRQVRLLTAEVAALRGVVGMPSLVTGVITPTLNSIQSLVACRRDGVWRVALFQNTPAQLHGRPDLVAEMTAELQALLDGE